MPIQDLLALADRVRRIRLPWENNPRQDRYSRRCAHADVRTAFRFDGDPEPLLLDLSCLCGNPTDEHRRIGGPHTDPPGCTGYRPAQVPRVPYYLRARLRPHCVVYPPFVGWLRGRANRAARRVVDRLRPYSASEDMVYLAARPRLRNPAPPVPDAAR